MKEKITLAFLGLLVVVLFANSADGAAWIYATVAVGEDNHLIRIDVNTGGTTDIGVCTIFGQPGHLPGLTGLSTHTDGQLYAFDTYGNQIITIDTTTVVGTLVTPVGGDLGGWMFGLAIEPSGDYYVTGRDLRKGTLPGPTVVLSPEYDDTDSCDLAPDGTLYATDEVALLTIDKTTGVQTGIRSWSDVSIAGIAIDGPIAWAI
ncbi:MAG: hypothetical protein K8R91_05295, partial [Phycisphaerae bacterium]|nr:hypothetical protein [Phycisphaerae bacterium]